MSRLSPVDQRILKLAVPALGALAVEPLYVLTDTAIVGRLGTDQLAGLAVAASVLSIVFGGSNFLTYGATERVARRIGAGDRVAAADVGVQTMWLAALVGTIGAPLLALFARPICSAFGADGNVLDEATTYLSISAIGIPFMLVTLGTQGVLRGASNYTTPLWILLASNAANLVLEITMVWPRPRRRRLGVVDRHQPDRGGGGVRVAGTPPDRARARATATVVGHGAADDRRAAPLAAGRVDARDHIRIGGRGRAH